MYPTKVGKLINADLNGAGNILKKVETQTVATRFRIWETRTRKLHRVALALRVVTV
jgi:transposase